MTEYKFPKDINLDIQPYFVFSSFTWSALRKANVDPRSVKTPVDTIILPMTTNGIIDNITHNWEEGAGLNASTFTDVFIKNTINKVVDSFGDLGKYISAEQGAIVNDYAGLAYSGTGFRLFDFTFNLAPKNAAESQMLQNLIKAFKRNSLPEYAGWKILYPNFWHVQIVFPHKKDIVKIKNCVLTSIISSYFPDNNMTILKDGNPVKQEMTLNFKELQKIDRRDYQDET